MVHILQYTYIQTVKRTKRATVFSSYTDIIEMLMAWPIVVLSMNTKEKSVSSVFHIYERNGMKFKTRKSQLLGHIKTMHNDID